MSESNGLSRQSHPPEQGPQSQSLVRMVRTNTETGPRSRFSCSSTAWDLLLEVGVAFGWKPSGTTYVPNRGSNSTDSGVRHDYAPGDDRDYKRVEVADAVALATALTEARRSNHLAAMIGTRPDTITLPAGATAEEMRSANAPFDAVMDEFIEYAFGGAFSFARAS